MNRKIVIALLALPISVAPLVAKSAFAADAAFSSNTKPIVVAQRYDDRWDNDRREEARRAEARRAEVRREEARREEARRESSRRVWIPAHWESGFLGIGRKWVAGHWETR